MMRMVHQKSVSRLLGSQYLNRILPATSRKNGLSLRALHVNTDQSSSHRAYNEKRIELESRWKEDRQRGIRRPYSIEDVASKAGTLQIEYPSSTMARKLRSLLESRAAEGLPVHTCTYDYHGSRTVL